jgi:hypothetical protein
MPVGSTAEYASLEEPVAVVVVVVVVVAEE